MHYTPTWAQLTLSYISVFCVATCRTAYKLSRPEARMGRWCPPSDDFFDTF